MQGATWPAEAIWEQVEPLLPGFTVEVLAEIDSTNSELMRRARAGRSEPVLLVAERQTAGRGRLGRQWDSTPLQSLTFSIGLPLAPADWSGLSLAVGVAVADALDPAVALKWPNDLWLQDRKLGGILVETGTLALPAGDRHPPRYAIVGIGVNIAARDASGLRTPPAALRECWPEAQAGAALHRMALPVVSALLAFERTGFSPFQPRFQARDALAGREVVLSDGRCGTAAGVDMDGALLVHTAAGTIRVTSADVSVRPA